MAISTVGFDGTVTEAEWAAYMRHLAEVGYKHGVSDNGMTATADAGTRRINISAGTAVVPGLKVVSDAVAQLTFAANATSVNRVDYAVMQADWAANAVTFAVVQGTSSTPPALTQNEGVLWQMPLARVTVRPSVTTLLSTDVVVCKPLPRIPYRFATTSFTGRIVAIGNAAEEIAAVSIPDPGWPYRLEIHAEQRFETAGLTAAGYAVLNVVLNSTIVARAITARMTNATGSYQAGASTVTDVVLGTSRVSLSIAPLGTEANNDHPSPYNRFEILQIPA